MTALFAFAPPLLTRITTKRRPHSRETAQSMLSWQQVARRTPSGASIPIMLSCTTRFLVRRSLTARRLPTRAFSAVVHQDDQDAAATAGCSETSAANLRQIFFEKGASAARYSYFAERADEEGATKAAILFRALSKSDLRHAHQALDAIDCYVGQDPTTSEAMGDSVDNLQSALVSEMHDFEKTMPDYAQKAQDDGDEDIADLFQGYTMAAQHRISDVKAVVDELNHNAEQQDQDQ